MKKPKNALVGMYVHLLDGNKEIQQQGRVISIDGNGLAIVQLYEWGFGQPSRARAIHAEVLVDDDRAHLYASSELMREAYERSHPPREQFP